MQFPPEYVEDVNPCLGAIAIADSAFTNQCISIKDDLPWKPTFYRYIRYRIREDEKAKIKKLLTWPYE